eukprot:2499762-Rhodomonas_salina.1
MRKSPCFKLVPGYRTRVPGKACFRVPRRLSGSSPENDFFGIQVPGHAGGCHIVKLRKLFSQGTRVLLPMGSNPRTTFDAESRNHERSNGVDMHVRVFWAATTSV